MSHPAAPSSSLGVAAVSESPWLFVSSVYGPLPGRLVLMLAGFAIPAGQMIPVWGLVNPQISSLSATAVVNVTVPAASSPEIA
jgi:hypothetical protein